jgi:hypothetical protein
LTLERLETRDCPAAPVITSFSAVALANHQVMLSGTVADENAGAVNVSFSGVAGGATHTDASGHFSLLTSAANLGTVFARGLDNEGLWSAQASAALSSAAPSITLRVTQLANRMVNVSGRVTDEFAGGLNVNINGVVNGVTTTAADGTFSFTGQASGLGQINVTTQDGWGLGGAAAATLTNARPQVVNFTAVDLGDGNWRFTGQVQDEYAAGMVVRLTGLPAFGSGLNVTVGQDGTFSTVANIGAAEGTVVALTTDWWGATSDPDYYVVY